ncbi:YigZ family protein [Mucilaginibacter sp. CSA2-8R]|uniref:IMPACT family protein n=1 Tax=Mucilaginibacter sp. CSA2-8R TaxID=3141542 RepID=UPI00315D05A8
MLFDDTFLTVKQHAEATCTDKGSKFIAFTFPIATDADVKPLLLQLKALHPKANHHCWAMRLSPDRSVFKVNDDGEPSGTAGRPILNVLLSKNITNTLVVVVRYFGGRLLGVPGLISAYKAATEAAITAAGVTEQVINDIYAIEFDYLMMNDVMRIIKEEGLHILSQTADNICSITVEVRKSKVNKTIDRLNGLNNIHAKFLYSS